MLMMMIPLTGRTVVVGTRTIDNAYRVLNQIMTKEGITRTLSRKRFNETPTKKRERLEYEKCLRIYNREMKSKVEFVMKKHKPLPPI